MTSESHQQSPIERRLEEMGVGDNDDGWSWFDPDEATAPEREADPETARKHLDDPEWLRERYLEDRWSSAQIADAIGVCDSAIVNALERHDIPRRDELSLYHTERNYSQADCRAALEAAAIAVDGALTVTAYQEWREDQPNRQPAVSSIAQRLGPGYEWASSLRAAGLVDRLDSQEGSQ